MLKFEKRDDGAVCVVIDRGSLPIKILLEDSPVLLVTADGFVTAPISQALARRVLESAPGTNPAEVR